MTPDYDTLSNCLKALAHPARLQILDMLRRGEVCVCHIETALGRRQAYVSQQLMVLRETGLVASRRDGLRVFYRLADPLAADLLDAALGPIHPGRGPARLEGCPCPACAVSVAEA